MSRPLSEIRPIPRRALSREEAAMYFGLSAGKFDKLVGDRRMPKPVKIDGRNVWDIRALDAAFDALSGAVPDNPWNRAAAELRRPT